MALRFAGHSFLIHKLEQRFITVRFQSVVKLLKKKKNLMTFFLYIKIIRTLFIL